MSDKPILFSAPMVRALLDGRKTQTRRVLRKVSPDRDRWRFGNRYSAIIFETEDDLRERGGQCEYSPYATGDRLWVREAWQGINTSDGPQLSYRATPDYFPIDAWDGPDEGIGPSFNYDRCPGTDFCVWGSDLLADDGPWRPGIHMPRWASRLTLTVTNVRVQRLQDISEEDAIAEGIAQLRNGQWHWSNHGRTDFEQHGYHTARGAYDALWGDINGPKSWPENPWIIALTFSVAKQNIDALQKEAA